MLVTLHHSICMCLHENAIQFDDCRISVFEVRVQVKFGKLAGIYLFLSKTSKLSGCVFKELRIHHTLYLQFYGTTDWYIVFYKSSTDFHL